MINLIKKNNLRLIKYGFSEVESYKNLINNSSMYYKYPYVLILSEEEVLNIEQCENIIQAKWDKRKLERNIKSNNINKKERI